MTSEQLIKRLRANHDLAAKGSNEATDAAIDAAQMVQQEIKRLEYRKAVVSNFLARVSNPRELMKYRAEMNELKSKIKSCWEAVNAK